MQIFPGPGTERAGRRSARSLKPVSFQTSIPAAGNLRVALQVSPARIVCSIRNVRILTFSFTGIWKRKVKFSIKIRLCSDINYKGTLLSFKILMYNR